MFILNYAEHNVVLKNCICCGSIYFHLFLGMVMHDNGFKQKIKAKIKMDHNIYKLSGAKLVK